MRQKLSLIALSLATLLRHHSISTYHWLNTQAKRQIPYTWTAAIFQICFIEITWYWWQATPPSGYAVAALAFAATIMAVRGTRFTRTEEVGWILIAFALFAIEIRAITKDRTDFARDEGQRRKEENAQFHRIADGLTGSIKQSENQFAATMEKSNQAIGLQMTTVEKLSDNLNTLTGADSFCYLGFAPGQQYLFFVHIGKFPLYGVSARVAELDQNGRARQDNLIGMTISVGDMIKGHGNMQPVPIGLGSSPDYFNANIFFTARYGDKTQLLRERRVNGKLVLATRVTGRFTSLKTEKALCETIDPDFPRKLNGDIDSDFHSSGLKLPRCQ